MTVHDIELSTTGPLDEDQVRRLGDLGLRVVSRLPGGARVRGESAAGVAELVALDFVDQARPLDPLEKLDPQLSALSATRGAATAGASVAPEPVTVLVSLDQALDPAATTDELARLGEVTASSSRRVVLHTTADRVADLAAVDGVLAAEVEPEITTQNNVAAGLTKVGPTAATLGLDGSGEIVGVADSGLDTGVPATVLADFAGRVVNIRASVTKLPADGADLNNHGTHVCGSIAGSGANSNGTIPGMAPAARLTVLSMGPNNSTSLTVPADLTSGVFADAYADGARVHSNSWALNNNLGKYTAYSEDVDEFVWANRDMLVVIAAGNNGPGASTVSAPGTAKNCLTVGASESVRPLPAAITRDPNLQDNDFNAATPVQNVPLVFNPFGTQADNAEDIAAFSGRGPVNDVGDNRTKPDIVAPGTFILSCRSTISTADRGPDGLSYIPAIAALYADDADGVATHAEAVGSGLPGAPFFGTWNQNTPAAPAGAGPLAQDSYYYSSGTSMATPITSGAVALLRQYLRERRGIANPSAALMKAFLVNAATVPAAASNAPDNTRGFGWLDLERALMPAPTGQQVYSDNQALAVATGQVRSLSVQVADPAQPLRVTLAWTDRPGKGLQNRLYLRVVPPAGPTVDGDITAFPNPTNNVQRVHIATPVVGTYTIEVHGVDVPFGIPALAPALRQDFAVVVNNGVGFSPNPVDVVQVVDHSGSMGFYGFMVPARERTKQLVDVLRVNDRTGVVMFDQGAATVHPVVPITGAATQTAIKAAIDGIMPAGMTSIGGGLQQGLMDLVAGGIATHPQALVVVSDGHENTPPWVGGGVTNSPPAWYSGGNMTEILPTVPPSTKIYTVSLGAASDAVLLQDLAAARGGLFQAINSAAETGKLHEIYVHLQALTGGEEVIVAGSDVVDGSGGFGGRSSTLGLSAVAAAHDAPELAGLLPPSDPAAQAALGGRSLENTHSALVDDSVTSAAFLVSWHNGRRPVTLSLVSPSLKVIKPTTTLHQVVRGTSYLLFRIESPEPGEWLLRVRGDRRRGACPYTWGVHGDTPLGLRLAPPKDPIGSTRLGVGVLVADRRGVAKATRLSGRARVPAISVADLLDKYKGQLVDLQLDLKPDTPETDPLLTKLPVLDALIVAKGGRSIFVTDEREAVPDGDVVVVDAPVPGVTALDVTAVGVTTSGFRFTRAARLDIQT